MKIFIQINNEKIQLEVKPSDSKKSFSKHASHMVKLIERIKQEKVKPEEMEAGEIKPEEIKPEEMEAGEIKPEEIKPEEIKLLTDVLSPEELELLNKIQKQFEDL